MPRPRSGERVLGPYRDAARGCWRVVLRRPDGISDDRRYRTEGEARAAVEQLRRHLAEIAAARSVALGVALERYEVHLITKGNKPSSRATTLARLHSLFLDESLPVKRLTQTYCAAAYADLVSRGAATDTHRNVLAESKTFCRWLVRQRMLPSNPLEHVEGQGRRRRGKAQLRIDEARRWSSTALALAEHGDPGALAALLPLYLDMRASEVVGLAVRDLDDDGRILWIAASKTEAGRRRLEVPELLRPLLLRQAAGREPTERLFGQHWRDWVRQSIRRICVAAGVPVVSAHGMRGTHASLATEAGISSRVLAEAMGHTSDAMTLGGSYATGAAVARGRSRKVLRMLDGGRRGRAG